MPPGVAVVDAFKNLIRHGKHHNHNRNDEASSLSSSAADTSRSRARAQQQQQQHYQSPQQQQAHHDPQQQQQQQRQAAYPQAGAQQKSQTYAKEIEQIVAEERESAKKMPYYKGLERFQLLDKMGDGAFSNVYKAVELATGKRVAVKVVRKYELTSSQAGDKHLNPNFKKKPRVTERANILKEVQIMQGINHPSIVKLISFSESPEHYFLVLELMEGGELFHQIVKLTYFSEALSRHVIVQVAQGIRYLHEERGVVHRDIKPENLLFDRVPIIPSKHPIQRQYDEEKEDEGEFTPGVGGGGIGRVKIADFGLSKVVWNEETMTPCGTVGYTAPEIVKDERYSKSVDMWALGCVLYTLLCGFPPFYDESINVLTEKVARGHYTFLSPWWDDISASAKDLITHLLCVDPAERYTIDEFLTHPWIKERSGPPPPPTPRFEHPLDSPLLTAAKGGRDGRSPGLATLKEAFDVTYAVHRMEEEGARRRAYKGRDGAGQAGFLQNLNEDDEDEDENLPPSVQVHMQGQQERLSDGRAGQRDQVRHRQRGNKFELTMDGATLLDRRHRRGGQLGNSVKPSPLAQNAIGADTIDAPQSPMHY
ncbi:kinase-like domain-containing protein [Vararia minispora EC-137]|uniref:Kinase-like domain-containing protein n=1 Tax=Vararia minispora EC-137 TaxID=1314806 RepID=A0ACB8QQ28_9AGAM|nr:kinase-like domain-containing protein [Vararia minispora EC-137]